MKVALVIIGTCIALMLGIVASSISPTINGYTHFYPEEVVPTYDTLPTVHKEMPIARLLPNDGCECLVILLEDGRSGWIYDPLCHNVFRHYRNEDIEAIHAGIWGKKK